MNNLNKAMFGRASLVGPVLQSFSSLALSPMEEPLRNPTRAEYNELM